MYIQLDLAEGILPSQGFQFSAGYAVKPSMNNRGAQNKGYMTPSEPQNAQILSQMP
jgi:hypothetical protein